MTCLLRTQQLDGAMDNDDNLDARYVATVLKEREESVRFFSAANRPERELWVANEFLTNLGMQFDASELVHVTDDPPDVRFRDAEFEIKEILDPGRRRHAEFKAAYERAKVATCPQDLLEDYTPRDITYQEIYSRIEANVIDFSKKYEPGTRSRMDLLFYVNLEDVHGYIATPLPSSSRLSKMGFRSVCFIMGRIAGVLAATASAPAFLKTGEPQIRRRGTPEERG